MKRHSTHLLSALAAVGAMMFPTKPGRFRAVRPGPILDYQRGPREEPKWVQDAKIAAAGEKRMRRRLRPQGSTS